MEIDVGCNQARSAEATLFLVAGLGHSGVK